MLRSSTVLALAVCAAALTFSPAASAQAKIAVVDLRRAILDTAEIKKASADLQAKFKPRQEALEKAQRELADLQAQMQSSQGKLSPQGEADLQSRGARKQREVQRLGQDLQDEVNQERDAIIQSAGQRMTEVLKKLAEEKGFDMIVDTTQLVTFKPALEITTDAIAAFDKAYPLKPGAPGK
jgi:outer membrane protein